MYLYSYPSTHSISGLAAGGAWEQCQVRLIMTIEWTQRYTLRLWSSEFGDAIGDRDWVNSEIHWEAVIEWVWRYTWRPRSSELGDALWGHDWVSSGMQSETEIELTQRYTLRPWPSEFGDALGGWDGVNSEMHLEAMIKWVWICPWRPWSSEFGHAIGGRDQVNSEMHSEAVTERVLRCTCSRLWSCEIGGVLEVVDLEAVDGRRARWWNCIDRLVNSKLWECDEVTLHLKLLWRTGWWWWIGKEVHQKLKLHSGVNSKSWEWQDDRQS